jgi:hypothetical protein
MTYPINRTPEHLRCGSLSPSCPSVSTIGDGSELVVIGKKLSPDLLAKFEGKIGEDEYAIVIGAAYFADLVQVTADRDADAMRSPNAETIAAMEEARHGNLEKFTKC